MTEKTLLVDNPFTLETNPKKLVQQLELRSKDEKVFEMPIRDQLYYKTKESKKYGIIKALEEEAEKMAKAREETLARDQKRDKERMKAKSATTSLWDLHGTSAENEMEKQMKRIKNVLKEKRETIAEFVKKKREICLSNMNIYNKKEETERLEDFIKNEKESLKARKFYFENDWTMVNQFIKEVEGDANEAQKEAERQQKEKEKNKEKLNQLFAEVERTEQKIARRTEELQNLLIYKNFIDKISEKYQDMFAGANTQHKDEGGAPSSVYLTDVASGGGASSQGSGQQESQKKSGILISPLQLRDILNHIQEKNLYYCQNNNESEEVFKNKNQEQQRLAGILLKQQEEYKERIRELERQRDAALRRKANLTSLKMFNVSKLQISEGEDLDMKKIGEQMFNIIKSIDENENKGGSASQGNAYALQAKDLFNALVTDIDSKEMRKQMHFIEKKVEANTKDLQAYINESEENAKRVAETAKAIKQNQSREKQLEKQLQIEKELNLRQDMREKNLANRRKGRAIMTRSLIQKTVVIKQEDSEDDNDDDEKYLKDEYDFGEDVLKQEKKQQRKMQLAALKKTHVKSASKLPPSSSKKKEN